MGMGAKSLSVEPDYENILVEGEEIITITLNRPDIHNPFDEKTISELTDCFSKVKKNDSVRIVIVTGAGRSFCAGADLNWMRRMADFPKEENVADAEKLSRMFESLESIEVPTIAKVNGVAFGGGAGLICACDFAIASDTVELAFSEVKLGLLPGVVSPYVIERIGVKKTVQLFTSGERVDAEKALDIGIIDHIVPGVELDETVEKLSNLIMTGGPRAVIECKRLARNHSILDRDSFKEYCIESIAEARASPEGKEGVRAFLEKRRPAWRKSDED
jgi:methylglutaconyl-CoA hydratase